MRRPRVKRSPDFNTLCFDRVQFVLNKYVFFPFCDGTALLFDSVVNLINNLKSLTMPWRTPLETGHTLPCGYRFEQAGYMTIQVVSRKHFFKIFEKFWSESFIISSKSFLQTSLICIPSPGPASFILLPLVRKWAAT